VSLSSLTAELQQEIYMSKQNILITGGAGFIGSHLADDLLRQGHQVRIFDNLTPQIHGPHASRPSYLDPNLDLVIGDVRDRDLMRRALQGIDAVYHLAATVGVGQSMYEIVHYTQTNNVGTAVLLEALAEQPVERLIVASSMSLYGEGLYQTRDGHITQGIGRSLDQLQARDWEVHSATGESLIPIPTPETKPPSLSSIYALSKYDQEQMCLMVGRAYQIPTVALRFFNVYGTRQALSNPYTGVLAIFASRLLNGNSPLIYEDGYQQRDFVHVYDVVQACRLALEVPGAAGQVFNVGSGRQYTIRGLASEMAKALNQDDIQAEVTGKYRMGDIRHCFADISQARQILGYSPQVALADGLVELADWVAGQTARDRVAEAGAELAVRGLTV
jgi:dTDP-L-rhamnose 4-epimerase